MGDVGRLPDCLDVVDAGAGEGLVTWVNVGSQGPDGEVEIVESLVRSCDEPDRGYYELGRSTLLIRKRFLGNPEVVRIVREMMR